MNIRVHHIINNYSLYAGGAARVVRALHSGLQDQKVESYILGLTQQSDPVVEGAQSLGLKSPYKLMALYGIYRYVKRNVRPGDVLHAHLFPPLFYLSLLKLLGQIPCRMVCTEHSTSNRRRGTRVGRLLDIVTYSGYEQVIAISSGVEQELLKWKPGLNGKTSVIFNGTSLYFKEMIYRKPKDRLTVLSVGNLRPAKNYNSVLKAIALLGDLDFEYRIAGEGDCREHLVQTCAELGLDSKVRFLGYVASIYDLLALADIFLMPSRWEGFGLAAVEAMNASLPLVVSDVAGLREIVSKGSVCAVLVDPNSPNSIADGLRQLLVSSDMRRQMGQNAFRQARQFNTDQMVDHYLDFYSKLFNPTCISTGDGQ